LVSVPGKPQEASCDQALSLLQNRRNELQQGAAVRVI
jgi:hypothetical protein